MKITGDTISFTTNWNNKLNCACFSTIRLHNPKKYWIGARMVVELNGRVKPHPATVRYIKTFYLNQLTEGMALLDTGYSRDKTVMIIEKMYKGKVPDIRQARFDFVILGYISDEMITEQINLFQS